MFSQLIDQPAAYITGTGDEQVYLLVGGFEEFFVEDVQRFTNIGGGNDGGDVSFGGSLGDGTHVNTISSEGSEHAAADARVAFHLFADEGHDRKVFLDAERLDFLEGDLYGEGFIHELSGIFAPGIVDAYADAVFGRTLSDENDVDLPLRKGFEKSLGKPGDTHHAAAFEAQQGDVVDA